MIRFAESIQSILLKGSYKDSIKISSSVLFSSTKKDYIGSFVCTAGLGIEKQLSVFEKDQDDYNSIMLKAIADRLADALTEYMHE